MISTLLLAFSAESGPASPEAVARSLAALVPAAVESLVRDVILVGPASLEQGPLRAIADHAGCALVAAQDEAEALCAGLTAGRQRQSLILRAGYVPRQSFLAELADLVAPGAGGFRRAAVLREEYKGLWRALAFRAPVAALLASRDSMLRLRGADLDDLARRIRPDASFECGALRVG